MTERHSTDSATPINVLFDHQVFASQAYGGVSRIFYELITHLISKKGVRVSLFQGLHLNRYPLEEFQADYTSYFGRRIVDFPHASFFLKPVNDWLFRHYARTQGHHSTRDSIDVYHPTGYSPVVSDWKKSPVVLHVYDTIPERFPHNFRDINVRLENKRRCIERADKIITISHFVKQDLLNHYRIDPEKIHVIYPGAPTREPGMSSDEPLTPYEHFKPYILYVGTRKQAYKNFEKFLLAYSSSEMLKKNANVLCFGGPPLTRFETDIMSMMNSLDNVFHLQGDDRLLARLYLGASAFVYPSLMEGFGLPPLEAMTYGCPVIAGNAPAIPEVLGEAAEYFDPASTESMMASMESVLLNDARRQQLIAKGYEQIKKYSWSLMADQIHDVYNDLLIK
ncbi:MAG: glycosyltransferase family 4 protein [Candidatus Omnitrophota bacterium]